VGRFSQWSFEKETHGIFREAGSDPPARSCRELLSPARQLFCGSFVRCLGSTYRLHSVGFCYGELQVCYGELQVAERSALGAPNGRSEVRAEPIGRRLQARVGPGRPPRPGLPGPRLAWLAPGIGIALGFSY
jgi:hypothetical protein